MILSNIKYAEKYYSVNPNFKAAFDFLKVLDNDFTGSFIGEGFSVNVFMPDITEKSNDDIILEAHRDYLDIQYCIEGAETFGYANTETLTNITEYDTEKDIIFLKGDFTPVTINKGEFYIVFPEDAHAPAMASKGTVPLKRAVVKIKL